MTDHPERRLGILDVTPEAIVAMIRRYSDFDSRYPGARHLAVHYDFDSDCFWFKFSHPSLPVHGDGARIVHVDPPAVNT